MCITFVAPILFQVPRGSGAIKMDDQDAVGRLYECKECGLRSLEFGPADFYQKTCRLCFGRFVEQTLGDKEPHQAADEVRGAEASLK